MSGGMVEQLAHKLFYADSAGNTPWEIQHRSVHERYRTLAREAIEELRDPTGTMLEAGDNEWSSICPTSNAVWHAMVDAALAQPKEGQAG